MNMRRQQSIPASGTAHQLSERERRFVEFYMGEAAGNATKAASLAGYSRKTARKQGSRLLTKGHIRAAVEERAQSDPKVANREDLQRWWTATYLNPKLTYRDRLKASELLGKSQAVFMNRHELDAGAGLVDVLAAMAHGEEPRR